MKKILLLIICLFLLTSCNDYVEINKLAIITGIGIDYKDNMYELTVQVINTEEKKEPLLYNTKGKTIYEALTELSKTADKKYFISHLKVLIISQNLIESNTNYYDYFLRNVQSKMNFFVYVSKNITPKELLNKKLDEGPSSMYIDEMLKYNNNTFSSSTPLEFVNLVKEDIEYGINPVYPEISYKDNYPYLSNLITYNYENKSITLDEEEAIFYNLMTNNKKEYNKKTILDISCEGGIYSLDISKINSKYNYINNIFKIDLKLESILNTYTCDFDITNQKNINKLNDITKKYILEKMNEVIKKSQENNNDFLGVGRYLYKHYYKKIDFNKEWDIQYPSIVIKPSIEIELINTGDIRTMVKK